MKSKSLGLSTKEKDAGSLRPLIYSAPTPGSVVDHGSLLGLGDDDHSQYVHISAARTITAQHDFAPASAQAPFTLGVNAQGELVTGLNADEVDGYNLDQSVEQASSPTFGGLTLNGALSLDGDLNFQGPQAITTTSGDLTLNPAGVLKVTPNADFAAGIDVVGSMTLDGDLNFQGSQKITTTAGNLVLEIAGHITIPSDTTRLYMGAGSDMYFIHSGSNGYWTNNTGSMVLATASGQFFLDYPADGQLKLILRSDENDVGYSVASIVFQGLDSGAAAQDYVEIRGVIADPSAGSEDGEIHVRITSGGAIADRLRIRATTFDFQQATSITTTTGNLILAPSGDVNITGHFLPTATDTYDVGSSAKLFRSAYISEMHALLFVKDEITIHGGWDIIGHDAGTLGADVGSGDSTVDFGKSMVNGDFVLIRAEETGGSPAVEYMVIVSFAYGTTYNVTRNLDGSGANNWSEGIPFLVLGASGDGRIELIANSTEAPNISILEQGATYNASTERVRIGNMRNAFGVGASDYWGLGVGDYSGGNYLKYDSNDGFEVGVGGGKILIDTDGIKLVEGGIAVNADGRLQWHRTDSFTVPVGVVACDDLGVGGAWGYPRHVIGVIGLAKDSETEGGGAYIHGTLDTTTIGALNTATMGAELHDHATPASRYGRWVFRWAATGGGPVDIMRAQISGDPPVGNVHFNYVGKDIDFIVSSSGNANMLRVDGGVNKVTVGGANPIDGWGLHIYNSAGGVAADGNSGLVIERASNSYINFLGGTSSIQGLLFGDTDADRGGLYYQHNGDYMRFRVAADTRAILFSNYFRLYYPLTILESAAAVVHAASYGQFWVKNTSPCEPWFDDDTGVSYDLFSTGWVGMTTYLVFPPYTVTTACYNLAIPMTDKTLKKWAVAFYCGSNQDASNYWTIELKTMNITTEVSVDTHSTAAEPHLNWIRYSNTSLSTSMSGIEMLLVKVTRTGNPGNLYLGGPAVFFA